MPERSEQKLRNKLRTLSYFERVVKYCEANPEAEGVVQYELGVCKEMVKLLPIKIARMKMELR